jgi:hypothetical protein
MRLRLSVLAGILLLAACTPPLRMESGWLPGARPATPFTKVLVVAVSDDFNRRRTFENSLAGELAAGGTVGIPSTRTMLTTDVVDRESVAALVKATGAEAVLVTRLAYEGVDVKQKRGREVLKMENPSDERPQEDPYSYNIYNYDYSMSEEPPSLEIRRDITVTTDLFETGEGRRIHTIRSEVRITNSESLDQNTDVAVIDKVATELARTLRRDRAVR